MSIAGKVYNHCVTLLSRDWGLDAVIDRVRSRYPQVDLDQIQEYAALAVRAFVAGAALTAMSDDGKLEDRLIPRVPDLEARYLYTIELTHNPGEILYLEIPSDVNLNVGQILNLVKQAHAVFDSQRQDTVMGTAGGEELRMFRGPQQPDVPVGTFRVKVVRVERE